MIIEYYVKYLLKKKITIMIDLTYYLNIYKKQWTKDNIKEWLDIAEISNKNNMEKLI